MVVARRHRENSLRATTRQPSFRLILNVSVLAEETNHRARALHDRRDLRAASRSGGWTVWRIFAGPVMAVQHLGSALLVALSATHPARSTARLSGDRRRKSHRRRYRQNAGGRKICPR